MTAFDAELYLRSLGERVMVDVETGQIGVGSTDRTLMDRSLVALGQAAAALIVGGAIDEPVATEINGEYAIAAELAIQSGRAEMLCRGRANRSAAGPADLEPRQVFTPVRRLSLPRGELHVGAVCVGKGRTTVEGSFVGPPGTSPPVLPPTLQLQAGGVVSTTQFSGGARRDGDNVQVDGVWECDRELPTALGWLDIDGVRLELGRPEPPPRFEIEQFAADERLRRYLWLLASGWGRDLGVDTVEPALSALHAAGLIELSDAELTASTWVANHRSPHWVRESRPRGPAAEADPGGSAPLAQRPWVLDRGGDDGEFGGTIGLGAVSPRYDGVMVAIDSVSIRERAVTAEIEISGATPPHHFPGFGALGVKPVAWWLSDEHGNRYFGQITGSSSSGTHTRGRMTFSALKGEPTCLTLTVATPAAAGILTVPVEWR